MNEITFFLRLLLYSDLYATLIVFVLRGIYNALSAIALLFFSIFWQSFSSLENLSLPNYTY